jgi:hypothetical protein
MLANGASPICRFTCRLMLSGLAIVLALCCTHLQAAEEDPGLLIDRQEFDRIILNAANGNAAIDVKLLDFPNRRVPDPFPTTGSLELSLLKRCQARLRYLILNSRAIALLEPSRKKVGYL